MDTNDRDELFTFYELDEEEQEELSAEAKEEKNCPEVAKLPQKSKTPKKKKLKKLKKKERKLKKELKKVLAKIEKLEL